MLHPSVTVDMIMFSGKLKPAFRKFSRNLSALVPSDPHGRFLSTCVSRGMLLNVWANIGDIYTVRLFSVFKFPRYPES